VSRKSDRRWSAHHFFYHGDLDVALRNFVAPAVAELLSRRLIDRFFFVRYTVGGPHLRLRVRLAAESEVAAANVAAILRADADRFLAHFPAERALDRDRIRAESRSVLAQVPEPSELYYEPNSLVPFPFTPESERYGGRHLLQPTLDFFAISSAQALEAVGDPCWESAGRRGALALRLLFRQALGFAAGGRELLRHLGYRLPVAPEVADEIWTKADRDFEARRETYGALLRHEIALLAEGEAGEPIWPSASFLYRAARRLSQAVAEAAPQTRWQIGHSHLHMTANRLGYFPVQEMYLQRILGRAAGDLETIDPVVWRRATAPCGRKPIPAAALRPLVEPVIRHLERGSPPTWSARLPIASP
jgi:hypothetical protein